MMALVSCQIRFFTATFIFWFYLLSSSHGTVEILDTYYPFHVKVGGEFTLRCVSNNYRKLEWDKQTRETAWNDELIKPTQENGFTIRRITEEPSGYSEIILTKKNVELVDQGSYICRDTNKSQTFSQWVSTLEILTQIVVKDDSSAVILHCKLSGFDTNPPEIGHSWGRGDDTEIPREPDKYIVNNTGKVSTSLTIFNPVKQDGGIYKCVFIFNTDMGLLMLNETHTFDASDFPNTASHHSTSRYDLLRTLILFYVMFKSGLLITS